jgi:hypothetical protein
MSTLFWPEIIDLKSASAAARQGFWAALMICGVDIAAALIMLGGEPIAGMDPLIMLDGMMFGAIAIGVWLRWRTAAVAVLALYVVDVGLQAVSLSGPWNPVMAALLLLAFVTSVRGTFRYRTYLRHGVPGTTIGRNNRKFAFLIFVLLRRLRFWRRKIFGKQIPYWAADLSGSFLGSLNFLELVPTIWAILFFPAHFFYRVPQFARSRGLYTRPIIFSRQLAVLTVGSYVVAYKFIGLDFVTTINFVGFCIFLPLILPIIGMIFWCVCAPFHIILRPSGLLINSTHFLILIDPEVYRRLRVSARSWGLIYYFGYALSVPQIAFLSSAGIVFLAFARTDVPVGSVNYALYLLLALVLLLDWVFIVPYCELLRVLVEHPTKRMFQSDIQRLVGGLNICTSSLEQYAKANDSWFRSRERKQANLNKRLSLLLEGGVHNAWIALQQRLRQDRRIEAGLNAEQSTRFLAERAEVYANTVFAGFARAWEGFAPGADEKFAFVDEMLQTVRAIAI